MRIDPVECRENAMKCQKLATETTDLRVQEILIEVAHCWDRLATSMADTNSCYAVPPSWLRSAPFLLGQTAAGRGTPIATSRRGILATPTTTMMIGIAMFPQLGSGGTLARVQVYGPIGSPKALVIPLTILNGRSCSPKSRTFRRVKPRTRDAVRHRL